MSTKQWHPMFVTSLREALSDAGPGDIEIKDEVALSSKPLDVDVLVVKKKDAIKLRHPVADIFRKYNLFEFKSPDDYLEPNDYDKGLAIARLYKVLEHPKMNNLDQLTLTFVSSRHPRAMLNMIKDRGVKVLKDMPGSGFYRVDGEAIPVQITVLRELTKADQSYMFSIFLARNEKLKLSSTLILVQKCLEDPKNVYRKDLMEFQFKNKLVTDKELEVILRMADEMSAEEKAKIEDLLANHPFSRAMFEKRQEKYRAQCLAQGREQGRQEGRAEGIRTAICRFLESKYGKDSADLRQAIHEISDPGVLDEVAGRLFTVPSLEEMRCIVQEGLQKSHKK
ncbi:MAG: hypothetical protein FH756_06850 [Firmicutes bacterium]|nr:hypothetical protein [Bacillota bacterium]